MTNYDITRVERKTAELLVINSSVQKRAENREVETTSYADIGHSSHGLSTVLRIQMLFMK